MLWKILTQKTWRFYPPWTWTWNLNITQLKRTTRSLLYIGGEKRCRPQFGSLMFLHREAKVPLNKRPEPCSKMDSYRNLFSRRRTCSGCSMFIRCFFFGDTYLLPHHESTDPLNFRPFFFRPSSCCSSLRNCRESCEGPQIWEDLVKGWPNTTLLKNDMAHIPS